MAPTAGTTTSLYGGGAPGRPRGYLPLATSGGAALGQASVASHMCSGHLGILLKCRHGLSMSRWGLRFCVSSSSLLVPGWSSYEETKPPKPESSHRGSPILKPRRRRSKRGDGMGGRGQSSVPEPWRAGQPCSGDEGGTWSKGWLGSLALKEGWSRRAERRILQPRNSQRSWRERAMWPWVQAALDGEV